MALAGVGQGDGEFLGHAAEDGFVDVLDAVRGAEDADSLGRCRAGVDGRCEAVPVRHESVFVNHAIEEYCGILELEGKKT